MFSQGKGNFAIRLMTLIRQAEAGLVCRQIWPICREGGGEKRGKGEIKFLEKPSLDLGTILYIIKCHLPLLSNIVAL